MILLLRGAKACVYPSIAEGFGIPPLESIAAKIPTLSSNQTAMSDFTFMNEFLFNPYNLNQFKSKLKLILKNENEYNFQSLAEQSKTIYSWEKSMNVLKESIKEHQLKK